MIGGAAINRRFGRRILLTEHGSFYEPGVFYCKDAFEGLDDDGSTDRSRAARQPCCQQIRHEAEMELGQTSSIHPAGCQPSRRSAVPPAATIPRPPTWGPRVVQQMPLDVVFQHLSKNELFRLSWGAKNTHGEAWEKLQAEFEARLDARCAARPCKKAGCKPQGVYGYWPAQSEGNDLIVYEPGSVQAGSPAKN